MTITKGKGLAALGVVGMAALPVLLVACASQPRKAAQPQGQAIQGNPQMQFAIASLNYSRHWMLAFRRYAEGHQGQCPKKFQQAASLLAEDAKSLTNFAPDQFEITFQGSLNEIPSPDHVIVIRQREAWQSADGAWQRAYGFADGHSEIHRALSADFSAWEKARAYPPRNQ